jgi:hypothetical protein
MEGAFGDEGALPLSAGATSMPGVQIWYSQPWWRLATLEKK